MKTKHLLALLATFCAIAALVCCARPNRQVSESSFDEKNLQPAEAPSSKELSQPVTRNERAFRNLDLDTNGVITLDEWPHLDTSARSKENFSALDENGDGQINVSEFLTQAPKHSKFHPLFGEAEQGTNTDSSCDQEGFEPRGLRLFSIRF